VLDAHNGIEIYLEAYKDAKFEGSKIWPTLKARWDYIVEILYKSKNTCVNIAKFDEKIIQLASSPIQCFKVG
jgi:hypothetical protein